MLQWLDWLIFAAFLAASLGIGIYHALTGDRQRTTREFLVADRKLKMLPTMLSLLVTLQSAIMILGHTAEMYTRGVQAWLWSSISFVLAILLAERLIVPWIYRHRLTSIYQYLEMRFESRALRMFAATLGILSAVLYIGVALYAPAIALETATGFPTAASVPIMAFVTIAYTALGGMRAVIWTDVFQFMVILGGVLAILIRGSIVVGGFSNAMHIAGQEGRLIWSKVSPDPTVRHTVWGFLIGGTSMWLYAYGLMQMTVQRYSSVKTLGQARMTFLLNIPLLLILVAIVCMIGIIVFAYYAMQQCDPLAYGEIGNANQLLPLFVRDVFSEALGFYGLFLATLYSGALSSVSSSLSGTAANMWEDILYWKLGHISEFRAAVLNKCLVLFFGMFGTAMAYLAMVVPGPITQVSLAFLGAIGGPVSGIYVVGGLRSLHWVEWKGALTGGCVGLALNLWMSLGSMFIPGHPALPPTSTEGCYPPTNITLTATPVISGLSRLYSVSYQWYLPIGLLVTVLTAIPVSLVVVKKTKPRPREYPPDFFLSWRDFISFHGDRKVTEDSEPEKMSEKVGVPNIGFQGDTSIDSSVLKNGDLDLSMRSDGSYGQENPPIIHCETHI